MTTREENLKKINDDLEKLSDEELDNVAGGTGGDVEDILKNRSPVGINADILDRLSRMNKH